MAPKCSGVCHAHSIVGFDAAIFLMTCVNQRVRFCFHTKDESGEWKTSFKQKLRLRARPFLRLCTLTVCGN